jgi:3-dehydroquinate synthase
MAYSATLANQRGLLSDEEHRRLLNLFSRAGLSMDHDMFDEDMLDKATKAILKTRDGLLRAAVPNPIGTCVFLNDVSAEEMNKALRRHKELMKEYPRNGEGLEAYVDASDTGYTQNDVAIEEAMQKDSVAEKLSNGKPAGLQGIANGYSNGYKN